jgi:hypothetical protein
MIARSLILSRPEKVDNIEVLNGSGAYSCLVLASRRRLKMAWRIGVVFRIAGLRKIRMPVVSAGIGILSPD